MRLLTVRLIISLILGITLVSLFSSYYEVRSEKSGLRRDLERRAEVLGDSLAGYLEPYLEKDSHKDSHKELQKIVDRFGNRQHLAGVAIYDLRGQPIAITPGLADRIGGEPAVVGEAVTKNRDLGPVHSCPRGCSLHLLRFLFINMQMWSPAWRLCTMPAISMSRVPAFGVKHSCACWCRCCSLP